MSIHDPICPPRFYYGSRKNQIIHCKLRINMSDLSFDLHNRHLSSNSSCRCGHAVESARHFFLNCPLYEQVRASTIDEIPQIFRNTSTILHGSNTLDIDTNISIFYHVHKFIELTGRFWNITLLHPITALKLWHPFLLIY